MTLFHPRVIEKHTKHVEPISDTHADILNAWAKHLADGIYDSETQNDDVFIQRILVDVLGYVRTGGGESWTVAKNEPVGKGNVDAALGNFINGESKIIAPFELKGAKTKDLDAIMPGRNKTPVQQAWEYAMDAKGAQWVLVSNYREIRLYAVGYGRKDYETFDLSKLTDPQEYSRFILLLSANNLLNGQTHSFLKESEQVDKDITNKLYADYKELRVKLIKTIGDDNPNETPLKVIRFTQTILDRILFVAFAEDKGLLPENTLKQAYETHNDFNPQPIWENFKGLFRAINKGSSKLNIPAYNGGLFADDADLDNLNISDELCEGFKKIGEYDFDSDVSVNILGHIFEQSISDLEEFKANAENVEEINKKQSKRKKDGIFYTPAYITRYIVEQAVGGWLSDRKIELGFDDLPALTDEDYDSIKVIGRGKRKGKITYNKKIEKHIQAWEAYKETLSNIKVLDPACGSGAFLNEVFDYLKAEGEVVNNQLSEFMGGQTAVFRWDTHILANNIYGVDLNSESVEITKLSLWLKTANRQEKLTYLDDNIRVGNSLIDDPKFAGLAAFNWNEEFSQIIDAGGFDAIVGNPPYVVLSSLKDDSFRYLQNKFKTSFGRLNTFALFIEQASLLAQKKNSKISLIIPDSICLIDYYSKLRMHLIEQTRVNEIIELGDGVFSEATVPAIILSFSYPRIDNNIIKIGNAEVLDERADRRYVEQKSFFLTPKNSFNLYADALFMKLNKLITTKNFYKLSDLIQIKIGICTGRNKKHLAPEPKFNNSRKVLQGKDINRYSLTWSGMYVNYAKDELLRARDEGIFLKNPKLLMRQTSDRLILCYDENQFYTIDSLFILYSKKKGLDLKFILCLLNSKLLNRQYQILNFEAGRVFAQVKIDYVNELTIPNAPYVKQKEFIELADKILEGAEQNKVIFYQFKSLLKSELRIEKLNRKLENCFELEFSGFVKEIEKLIKPEKLSLSQKSEWMEYFEKEKSKIFKLKNKISEIDREIDQLVYKLYELTPEEIKLIESSS